MVTYKEQFDKLTRAYIQDKVKPYDPCACFIGNLLSAGSWSGFRHPAGCTGKGFLRNSVPWVSLAHETIAINGHGMYTPQDILDMENNFLGIIAQNTDSMLDPATTRMGDANYENALFMAFESTLEMLKQIHIRNGEVIEETPQLTKRVLVHC